MSRYVLSVVYLDGVPQEIARFESLAEALKTRDIRTKRDRANPANRSHWMVWDAEDQERGYADRCPSCGVGGSFGLEETCAECDERHRDRLNPTGFCLCGCGERAPVAKSTSSNDGWFKGQRLRYIQGHHKRSKKPRYLEVDAGYETPCWIWQRHIHRDTGYGSDHVGGGRNQLAHRAMYERIVGPIPEGNELDHLCRNRACVNPDHLEPVTHAENGRRGASAKLTPTQVAEIRRSSERAATLARRYGVSTTCVSQIRSGERWQGVPA